MIADIINKFREENGKEKISYWNLTENDNCFQHCLYMANRGYLIHALEAFRKDKAEVITTCSFMETFEKTMRYLIYECINKSEEHRDIVLNYENLAYGFYMYNYAAYLTIRGW